jgi:hypothetical protein
MTRVNSPHGIPHFCLMQELNKFMLDQVTQRRTEAPVSMALDIAIPMKLRQHDEFVEPPGGRLLNGSDAAGHK